MKIIEIDDKNRKSKLTIVLNNRFGFDHIEAISGACYIVCRIDQQIKEIKDVINQEYPELSLNMKSDKIYSVNNLKDKLHSEEIIMKKYCSICKYAPYFLSKVEYCNKCKILN